MCRACVLHLRCIYFGCILQVRFMYCACTWHVLHVRCMHFLHSLYMYFTCFCACIFVCVLHGVCMYFASFVHVFFIYFASSLHLFCKYFACVVHVFCFYAVSILHVLCICFCTKCESILLLFPASILHVFCIIFAYFPSILHLCCIYVPYIIFRRYFECMLHAPCMNLACALRVFLHARLVLEATMAKLEQKLDMLLKAVAFGLMGKNWDQPLGEPMSLKEGAKEKPGCNSTHLVSTKGVWFQYLSMFHKFWGNSSLK